MKKFKSFTEQESETFKSGYYFLFGTLSVNEVGKSIISKGAQLAVYLRTDVFDQCIGPTYINYQNLKDFSKSNIEDGMFSFPEWTDEMIVIDVWPQRPTPQQLKNAHNEYRAHLKEFNKPKKISFTYNELKGNEVKWSQMKKNFEIAPIYHWSRVNGKSKNLTMYRMSDRSVVFCEQFGGGQSRPGALNELHQLDLIKDNDLVFYSSVSWPLASFGNIELISELRVEGFNLFLETFKP